MIRPFIAAYWSAREESRSECAARLAEMLRGLTCEPAFQKWYGLAKSRENAKRAPVEVEEAVLEKMLETNNTDFGRKPITELGFSFDVWNGDHKKSAKLSIGCGCYSERIPNCINLYFPVYEDEAELGGKERFELIMNIIVSAWEPDEVIVTTDQDLDVSREFAWENAWFKYRKPGKIAGPIIQQIE